MFKGTCESCGKQNVWTVYVENLAGMNICRECVNRDFDSSETEDTLLSRYRETLTKGYSWDEAIWICAVESDQKQELEHLSWICSTVEEQSKRP